MTLYSAKAEYLLMGTLLKKFRKSNALTQKEIAKVIMTSASQVQYMENGMHPIRSHHLVFLAKTYRLNPMYLLGLSKDMYLSKVDKGYQLHDKVPIQASPDREL